MSEHPHFPACPCWAIPDHHLQIEQAMDGCTKGDRNGHLYTKDYSQLLAKAPVWVIINLNSQVRGRVLLHALWSCFEKIFFGILVCWSGHAPRRGRIPAGSYCQRPLLSRHSKLSRPPPSPYICTTGEHESLYYTLTNNVRWLTYKRTPWWYTFKTHFKLEVMILCQGVSKILTANRI